MHLSRLMSSRLAYNIWKVLISKVKYLYFTYTITEKKEREHSGGEEVVETDAVGQPANAQALTSSLISTKERTRWKRDEPLQPPDDQAPACANSQPIDNRESRNEDESQNEKECEQADDVVLAFTRWTRRRG